MAVSHVKFFEKHLRRDLVLLESSIPCNSWLLISRQLSPSSGAPLPQSQPMVDLAEQPEEADLCLVPPPVFGSSPGPVLVRSGGCCAPGGRSFLAGPWSLARSAVWRVFAGGVALAAAEPR